MTVQGGRRQVELQLPAAAPIGEYVPALVRLCEAGAGAAPDGRPAAWSLARALPQPPGAGGSPAALGLTVSLVEAGVRDGEVLRLVDTAAWQRPEARELADVVSAAVELGPRWTSEASGAVVAGMSVGLVLVAAALAVRTGAVRGGPGLAALLAAASLAAGAIALRPRSGLPRHAPARLAMVASAWVLAGLGAWGVAGTAPGASGLAVAALAATVAALVACPAVPALGPGVALGTGALAAAASAVARGVPTDVAAAAVAVAGLVVLWLLPPVVSALVALLGAPARPGADLTIVAMVARSRRLVASLSCGVAAAVVGAAAAAFAAGGAVTIAVATMAALALVPSARPFRYTIDVLPPVAAAGVALVALEAALAIRLVPVPAAVALLGTTGAALAVASAAWRALPSRAFARARTHGGLRDHRAGAHVDDDSHPTPNGAPGAGR